MLRLFIFLFVIVAAQIARAETFSNWRTSVFTPAQLSNLAVSGPLANPDADTFSNLAEYAFALEPFTINNSDEALAFSIADPATADFLFTYTQRKNAIDLLYQIEYSGDLNNPLWNLLTDPKDANPAVDLGQVWQRTLAIPQHFTTREFLRLRLFQYPNPGQPPVLNDPPQSLTATLHPPFLDIDLTWIDRSNRETGYRIERRPDGTLTWRSIATTNSDTVSYRDTHLAGNTSYHYRVTATLKNNTLGQPSSETTLPTPLDSDGDNLPDTFEVQIGTDPSDSDSDNDGLSDGYEVEHGTINYGSGQAQGGGTFNPLNADTNNNGTPDGEEDDDSDGLTNAEENIIGTEPWNAYSDGDTKMDGEEAIPTDKDITFARTTVPHYAVVELPEDFEPHAANAKGRIVGEGPDGRSLWVGGSLLPIPVYTGQEVGRDGEDQKGDLLIDDQDKIICSHYFDGKPSDKSGSFTGVYQYNGTAVVRLGNNPAAVIPGLYTTAKGIAPSGMIFGTSAGTVTDYWEYEDNDNSVPNVKADRLYSAPTVWVNGGAAQELKGLPGENDRTLILTGASQRQVTVLNAKGLDDEIDIYGAATNGRLVGNTVEYEGGGTTDLFNSPPLSQRKSYALLWPSPTELPASLGENAQVHAISQLNIAAGLDGSGTPSLWLGVPDWKRKDLPLYEQKPEDLYKNPIAINSKGLILLDYITLWANGFTYDLAELANEPTGTITATQLTESGVMLGKKTDLTSSAEKNILLVPVEVNLMKPDVTTWNDADELLEKQVLLFDDKLRVRIKISMKFNSLAEVFAIPEFTKLKFKTNATQPAGIEVTLTPANSTFVAYETGCEVRVALTRDVLKTSNILPQNDEDNVDEKSWYDAGDPNGATHNLTDGLAFDSGSSAESRLRGTKQGHLKDTIPNCPIDKTFLQAAGAEVITAGIGGAVSKEHAIANQADTFYISTEGHITTGMLDTDSGSQNNQTFGPGDAKWNKELETVIVAGCSIFAIKDYRAKEMTFRQRLRYVGQTIYNVGTPSPGETWENAGPKYLLGYAYSAPTDNQGAAGIISSYLTQIENGTNPIQAWGTANNGTTGNNACAIDVSTTPHKYWYLKRSSASTSGLVWTSVSKGPSGW